MTTADDIALCADNLSVVFDGRTLLEGFSLEVSSGQKVLMTGPSGCGKSTILRCFLGLAAPRTGSIAVAGQPLTPATVWHLRRQIGYVGQEPDLGSGTVRQLVEAPFHYRANAHLLHNLDRLNEFMDLFSLAGDLLQKNVARLSGGEKQRIALIIAILLDRPILLLDEPTSALDVQTRKTLGQYLESQTKLTVLAVAHDTDSFTFADRAVELSAPAQGAPE
jgi:ABC-type bacteriocin/lantibiotic exporter with double-glycine peptidase domain